MLAVWKYDSAIRKRRKALTPMCVQREGDKRNGGENATILATNKRASLKRLIFCTGTAHAEFKSWEW